MVQVIGVNHLHLADALGDQLVEHVLGDLGVGFEHQLAGRLVDDVLGQYLADHVLAGHLDLLEAGLVQQVDVAHGDAPALLDDELALVVVHVEIQGLAAQPVGDQVQGEAVLRHVEGVGVEEHG